MEQSLRHLPGSGNLEQDLLTLYNHRVAGAPRVAEDWQLRERDVLLVPLEAQLGLMGLERTLYMGDRKRKYFKKSWVPA